MDNLGDFLGCFFECIAVVLSCCFIVILIIVGVLVIVDIYKRPLYPISEAYGISTDVKVTNLQ